MVLHVTTGLAEELLDTDYVLYTWAEKNESPTHPWRVRVKFRDGEDSTLSFANPADRDAVFTELHQALEARDAKKGHNMLKDLIADFRNFLRENRDLVFTIALIALADQLFFEGAFRERLKRLIEGLLNRTEAKVIDTVAVKTE